MTEKQVENRLKKGVEKLGGLCYKWISPGNDGVMDRIVVLPKAHVWFVELKCPGGRLRPVQKFQRRQLEKRNARVRLAWDFESVDLLIEEMKNEITPLSGACG